MKATGKKNSSLHTGIRLYSDIDSRARCVFVLFTIAMIPTKLCLAAAPSLAGKITDELVDFVGSGIFDKELLMRQCGVLALLFLIGYGIDGFMNRSLVKITQKEICDLRNRAQQKLNRLPIGFIDSHPSGDILARVTNDMAIVSASFESNIPMLLGQFVLLGGLAVMMIMTNFLLAAVYLVILPLGLGLFSLIMRKTADLYRAQNKILGELSSYANDTYSNHTLIKAYGCEKDRIQEFESLNGSFNDACVKGNFVSGFAVPMAAVINSVSFIALCIIGGIMLINKQLTIGEFQAFIFYGNMIGAPLTTLSSSLNSLQSGITGAERIYELLDQNEEEPGGNEQTESVPDNNGLRGRIVFDHVSFGYYPDSQLMSDVSLNIEAGRTVAIAGPSGAGKTTLVNLLMRFYEIWGGSIRIDGTDIRSMSRKELRRRFGMVLQDPWIFEGTIRENIAYGKPGASMDEIVRAAALTHCDSFIGRIPDGYDAVIGGETGFISEGEKQLIALARVVIADPDIMILDEATSMVDTVTEDLITEAMQNMMEGRTALIIAHRLYTIRNADLILYVEDGCITESGNHEELLKQKGAYASMYVNAAGRDHGVTYGD